jgi:hypothetical protein
VTIVIMTTPRVRRSQACETDEYPMVCVFDWSVQALIVALAACGAVSVSMQSDGSRAS